MTKKQYYNLYIYLVQLLYKNYFVLIRKQDIKSGSNRTLDYLRNKVFEKLEKHYL